MAAFISSSPPLTMSVSRGRSGRMMYDPYQPQHLVRRTERQDIRPIWWDICTIYAPLFVSIENVNHFCRARLNKERLGFMDHSLQWNCPICCIVCVLSLLKLLSVIRNGPADVLSLCKTLLGYMLRSVIPSANTGHRTGVLHMCFAFEWLWLILTIIRGFSSTRPAYPNNPIMF